VEFSADDVASDLIDLDDVPLDQVDPEQAGEVMRRVAPTDGSTLLVAASFNSAI